MDDEIRELMKEYDIDEDTAEKAQELIDMDIDEDEAVELAKKYSEPEATKFVNGVLDKIKSDKD